MSARWKPAEKDRLTDLARKAVCTADIAMLLKRPEGGVRRQAEKLDLNLTRPGPLEAFLGRGGALVREEVGAYVRWCTASRSGLTFKAERCDLLLSLGVIVAQGSIYRRAA